MTINAKIAPAIAFLAGIVLTLGLKDFYPDLERRFRRGKQDAITSSNEPQVGDRLRITENRIQEDRSIERLDAPEGGQGSVLQGIEGCIGNTPLFRIKSLSEETGCEILAKAEVRASMGMIVSI